jgi:hypothetical protein
MRMDFGMSTRRTAAVAVDVLRRVGYHGTWEARRRTGVRGHVISVAAARPWEADEVLRVVQRVDPDAKPLDSDLSAG